MINIQERKLVTSDFKKEDMLLIKEKPSETLRDLQRGFITLKDIEKELTEKLLFKTIPAQLYEGIETGATRFLWYELPEEDNKWTFLINQLIPKVNKSDILGIENYIYDLGDIIIELNYTDRIIVAHIC